MLGMRTQLLWDRHIRKDFAFTNSIVGYLTAKLVYLTLNALVFIQL